MATLRTGPGERGSEESVEGSGEGFINRLFSQCIKPSSKGLASPCSEMSSSSHREVVLWSGSSQFPNRHSPPPPHTEQDCARKR